MIAAISSAGQADRRADGRGLAAAHAVADGRQCRAPCAAEGKEADQPSCQRCQQVPAGQRHPEQRPLHLGRTSPVRSREFAAFICLQRHRTGRARGAGAGAGEPLLLDPDMVKANVMLAANTTARTSATQGSAGRLPTSRATNEIVIEAAHGQRCSRHNSQGASPPQYCDNSAAPRTTADAVSAKPAKLRVGQHHPL